MWPLGVRGFGAGCGRGSRGTFVEARLAFPHQCPCLAGGWSCLPLRCGCSPASSAPIGWTTPTACQPCGPPSTPSLPLAPCPRCTRRPCTSTSQGSATPLSSPTHPWRHCTRSGCPASALRGKPAPSRGPQLTTPEPGWPGLCGQSTPAEGALPGGPGHCLGAVLTITGPGQEPSRRLESLYPRLLVSSGC